MTLCLVVMVYIYIDCACYYASMLCNSWASPSVYIILLLRADATNTPCYSVHVCARARVCVCERARARVFIKFFHYAL